MGFNTAVAAVLRDLGLCLVEGDTRRAASLPYGGRFLDPSGKPDLRSIKAAVERRGLTAAAREFALGSMDAATVSELQMHLEFGKVRLQSDELQAAQQHFEAALALDKASHEAWAGLGYIRQRRGELESAAEAYRTSLQLQPSADLVRLNLGRLLYELGDAEGLAQQMRLLEAAGSGSAGTLKELLETLERGSDD